MNNRKVVEDILGGVVRRSLERMGMERVEIKGFSRDFSVVEFAYTHRTGQRVHVSMRAELAFPEKLGPSQN